MIPDLKALRVLEVGTAVSVPEMGAVLCNLGADVIKVESKHKLDGNRVRIRKSGSGDAANGPSGDDSFPLWHEFNGGKRSVQLNLKSEVAKDIFVNLIKQSDVFIQNFAPGWLERLGLGGKKLLEINPRLIMLFASGYGQDGPKSQQRVYAPVMTALGGQEALVGDESGEVMGAMPIAFGDFNSAFHGVLLLFSALYQREQTGQGCIIDVSQIEAVAATLGEAFVEMQITGKAPQAVGNRSDYRAPHGVYPCRGNNDQWVTLSIGDDTEWNTLKNLIRKTDAHLADELDKSHWDRAASRIADRLRIDELVSKWTGNFSRDELPEMLQRAGIRSAPVYESDEMEKDPHFMTRSFTRNVVHPHLGSIAVTSTPWMFDGATPIPRAAGPSLGEHTEAVLVSLCGLTPEKVETFKKEGHLA